MLPNLFVIGARKCGTTSIYHYLHAHPEISMSKRKEPRFFVAERRSERERERYESLFGADPSVRLSGEASTAYTAYPIHRGVPERMHSLVPEAKLIYLVRDPLERIVSHWVDVVARGRERRSLVETVTPSLDCLYVAQSSYHLQLSCYLPYFPAERILVLTREELLTERRPTLRRVFRFLGVDDAFDSPTFDQIRHRSGRQRIVEGQPRWLPDSIEPEATGRLPWIVRRHVRRVLLWPYAKPIERPMITGGLRESLVRVLGPDADRLRSFTGKALEDWSV
jgi:sulfotransferase family protein